MFNIQETFKSEIAWYTTVIPTLKQFQKDHGVEKEIDFFQKFYGARISLDPTSDKVDLDGVMLTQNLKYLGYYNEDRHVGFDLPTTRTLLRDFATFHAVPLALKLQNPELFEKKIKPHLPTFGNMDEALQKGFNKQMISIFEEIPECEPFMDRISKYIDEAKAFTGRPLREPWVTVIHMDAWMNNVMITGGQDSKNVILDLQIPTLGSPAADLVFLLLTSVNLEVVKENFDDLVEYYYAEFTRNLRELDVSNDNYTLDGLLEEIEKEVKIGEFGHSLGHSFAIFGEKGKSDFDASDENFKMENLENFPLAKPNKNQIEKFKWIATEAVKRKWI
jgi:hypothetical protein